APFGAGGATSDVWSFPSASMARTVSVCVPDVAGQGYFHGLQVSGPVVSASCAGCQVPWSTCTSTADTPVCWAHATPATTTVPGSTVDFRGTSIREASLIGPFGDQPSGVQ